MTSYINIIRYWSEMKAVYDKAAFSFIYKMEVEKK